MPIDCANQETVYATVEHGRLTLSDRRETFAWLEAESVATSRPVGTRSHRTVIEPFTEFFKMIG